MRKLVTLIFSAIAVACSGIVIADTLELANGEIHEGNFVGSSNGVIMFDTGAGVEAFPEGDVVGVFFSSGVDTAIALLEDSGPESITIPAGTRLVIRTVENIDSGQHSAGHRFRGQTEGALVVDGVTAVPRGSFVHGRLIAANQSGRLAGRQNS